MLDVYPQFETSLPVTEKGTCLLAASAASTHALLAGTIRSAVTSSGSAHVRLAGDGAEGGAIAEVLEFKNPFPAGVAVGPDGRPTKGLRADMRLQLGAPGGEDDKTIFADVVVTAAVPIAIQPVTGANGWPEPPVIPPRLLSRTGAAAADGERDKNKLYGDRPLRRPTAHHLPPLIRGPRLCKLLHPRIL